MRECTEAQFLKDVANHKMTVLLDSGIYRHVEFKKPGRCDMWFDLITWPGCLTVRGDMGTWTFARVEDMFKFFRSNPNKLEINADYWSEKLCTGVHGGRDSAEVWEEEVFRANLIDQ